MVKWAGALVPLGPDAGVGLGDNAPELCLEECSKAILDVGVAGVWDVADGEEKLY